MKDIIETKENKVMELFNLFGDISSNVFMDLSKIEVLMLRRHQNFLMSHPEFLDNINDKDPINPDQIQDLFVIDYLSNCQKDYCIYYTSPSSQYPADELMFKKIMMLMIPLSKIILKSKYYDHNNIAIITRIHFISNNKIFYQFSPNDINTLIKAEEIEPLIEKIKMKYKNEHMALLNQYNTIVNTSYENLTLNNPAVFTSFSPFVYPSIFNALMLPSTVSIEFTVDNKKNISNEQFNSFTNYTGVYWSEKIIEELSSSLSNRIKGLYMILLANIKNYPVLSASSCHLLRRLVHFYITPEENYTITKGTTPYDTLDTCFPYKEAKDIINKTIIQNNITREHTRSVVVPLATYNKKYDVNNVLQFKVLQSLFPNKSISSLINSPFYITFPLVLLFFKNINGTLIQIQIASDYFQNVVLVIIAVFIVVWSIVFIYIIIRVYSVARQISDPIQKLINSISMNMQDEDSKGLDSITYKDDKDINDLFKICKELIFGGFNLGLKHKKENQLNVYNNIALVKSNNIMINEYNFEGKRDEDTELLFGTYTLENKEEQSPLKKFENEVYKKFTPKEYENEIVNYLKKTMMDDLKDKKRQKTNDIHTDDIKQNNNDIANDINKEMAFMKKIALDKPFTFRNDSLFVQYKEIFLNDKKDKKK